MKKVCYGIVGKTKIWMTEACISENPEDLIDELELAQLEDPDEEYAVVALYSSQWISANDQHPKGDKDVLVMDDLGITIAHYSYRDGSWYTNSDGTGDIYPTQWQELPL